MKKAKKLFLFGLVMLFTFCGFSVFYHNSTSVKADSDSETPNYPAQQKVEYSNESYENYLAESQQKHQEKYNNTSYYPNETIRIAGTDYYKSDYTDEKNDSGKQVLYSIDATDKIYEDVVKESKSGSLLYQLDEGTVTWKVNVKTAGFYTIYLRYYTVEGYSSSIERSFTLNGQMPFSGCASFTFYRVWQDSLQSYVDNGDGTTSLKKDTNGNDVKPKQIENHTYRETYLKDNMGYVTTPYQFYFDEGTSFFALTAIKEPIMIDYLELQPVESTSDYEGYLNNLKQSLGSNYDAAMSITNSSTRIEAEKTSSKSSPTLYPQTDRSSSKTTPFSYRYTKLNIIGGESWSGLGDWITWEFTVPTSGFYNISMRAKQAYVRGMYSSRCIYIDGQIPFDELGDTKFSYSANWQNYTLGDENGDYSFYLEAGVTHTITMEVTLGQYGPIIERLQNCIDELSAGYRQIIAYTTTNPDTNRDYQLDQKFPDLFYGTNEDGTQNKLGKLQLIINELNDISARIKEISGGGSDKTGVIDSVTALLQKFVNQPRRIPQRLSTYSQNISSLGTLLNQLRSLPLGIDYIEVHSADVKLKKANVSFFRGIWDDIVSFVMSFFIDYSSIGEIETSTVTDEKNKIEVWMTAGRDQANILRTLIDTTFTKETGIKVDLKLTGSDVLLKATLAGIGPDVAINVDSTLPVNYALRNAVLDLTEFSDFWDTVYAMPDGAETWNESYDNVYYASSIRQFQFSSGVTDSMFDSSRYTPTELSSMISGIYALPERQTFLMMFVRDDIMDQLGLTDMIPETWNEVIDLVGEMQTQQLQFYLPVNELGATALNQVFVSLLYQNGGSLYANDNKECGLTTEAAMKAFETWTRFYTLYSFPKSASFVNRFRTGEMPIGIASYDFYNTLSISAPELKGKWSYHLIPGTTRYNEDGTSYVDHTSSAAGAGAVILKGPATKNEKIKNNSWEFLKWWTSASTQVQYGRELEGVLGAAGRLTTANVKALQSLDWSASDLSMLMKQWSYTHEMPNIAGSYMTGREVENAYRSVINNYYNPRETLYEYAQEINNEIDRKRAEFKLPLKEE